LSGQNHARKRARAAPQRSCISTLTRCAQTPFRGRKARPGKAATALRWSSDGRVSSGPARSTVCCPRQLPTFVDIAGDDVLAELDYDSRTREVLQRTLKYRRRATGTSPRKRECCRALCVS